MRIYDYEEAFGDWDRTTKPMRQAISRWENMYFGHNGQAGQDGCMRIPYAVVDKLVKTVFGEYTTKANDPEMNNRLEHINSIGREAMQLMMIGGECYIKPWIHKGSFAFNLVPRTNILIFNRNSRGEPTDTGLVECSVAEGLYYTLLERRKLDQEGFLTIENKLFRSNNTDRLGQQVPLAAHPAYASLGVSYRFPHPLNSIGMVRLRTPMLNCVDGSPDGVAVYAAATELIDRIDRNEEQMNGEFDRGESRIIVSADMLRNGEIQDHLFVGLDEDPEQVGMTVFSPELREQSFLARKREYLRNAETIMGLKRGMLSDVSGEKWTATEVSSSAGEFNLTIMALQAVWEQALGKLTELCSTLAGIYGIKNPEDTAYTLDWGNGILFDEDRLWQDYLQMVEKGLICPEVALGWRFHMPAGSEEEKEKIRRLYMPY